MLSQITIDTSILICHICFSLQNTLPLTVSTPAPVIRAVANGNKDYITVAFDAFLWIDDLDGESTDQRFAGWIELIDFGLAVRQTVSSTNSSSGGASAERVDFSPFLLKKQVDTTSPKLALACAAGNHIDKIIIAICRAGSSKLKFMEYRLLNCIISKFRAYGGHQTGYPFPTESVSIDYGQIQWHYLPQTRRGGAATGSYVTGWDLQVNKKQ